MYYAPAAHLAVARHLAQGVCSFRIAPKGAQPPTHVVMRSFLDVLLRSERVHKSAYRLQRQQLVNWLGTLPWGSRTFFCCAFPVFDIPLYSPRPLNKNSLTHLSAGWVELGQECTTWASLCVSTGK